MDLSPQERLTRALSFQEVDRIPTIGGWIGGARVLAEIAGCTPEQYLEDPAGSAAAAHRALGVDGIISPIVPAALDQVRTGAVLDSEHEGVEPEDLVDYAEGLPDPESVRRGFNWEAAEQAFCAHFEQLRSEWHGLVPLPNFWDLGGHFPLYVQFGYEAFLGACALHPQAVGRIWQVRSEESRCRAEVLAGLIPKLGLTPVHFCGEDLCNNQGPMVAPLMLREHYFPTVRRIIEPLVDSGVKLIHHCDGDIQMLVQDYLDMGFAGLQGFQYELGVSIASLRRLKTPFGHPPIIWAGLSVTTTLPFGAPEDVEREVDGFVEDTDGGMGLFLFTSNVTGVEVPPDNIRAGYLRAETALPCQRAQDMA